MRVRILGPLEIWENGRELHPGPGRQRTLLAVLLVHANEVVSVDRLVEALWNDHPPATAAKIIQGYVSQLRKTLPRNVLMTRPSGYVLSVAECDAREFERLLGESRAQSPPDALRTLCRALQLWRGPALADVEYEDWAQSEIARLDELRLTALEERVEAQLQLGSEKGLSAELGALVAEHPLRERLRAQLMVALYRSGRQADALETYADARRQLVAELGIEPGPGLRDLHRRILDQDPALGEVHPVRPPLARRGALTALNDRRLASAAVALPSLVAAVGVTFWLMRGSRAPVAVVPNSVVAVDPATDRVVTDIPVGDGPERLIAAGGYVWSLNGASRTVSRIDATRVNGVRTFAIGPLPGDVAYGDGALWTAVPGGRTLDKIDPETGVTVGTVRARIPSSPTTRDGGEVAYGSNAVWFGSSHATITRVDPKTLHVVKTIPKLDVGPGGQIVAGPDAVWIDDSFGNITELDPTTDGIVGEAHLATAAVGGIAATPDAAWATAIDQGLVWEIDPLTTAPVDSFHVGADPIGVTVGAGSVWVANAGGTLTRLDPATGKTTTIRLADNPRGVVFADKLIWVGID